MEGISKKTLWYLLLFLDQEDQDLSEDQKEKIVGIEGAINGKTLCDYTVRCSYRDVVFMICILHDYIKQIEEKHGDELVWGYYSKQFLKLADRLAAQIEYDYEKALKKCNKNLDKQDSQSSVGADALSLAAQRGMK